MAACSRRLEDLGAQREAWRPWLPQRVQRLSAVVGKAAAAAEEEEEEEAEAVQAEVTAEAEAETAVEAHMARALFLAASRASACGSSGTC